MDLYKLFEAQKILDGAILEEKKPEGGLLEKKIVAAQVEFAEFLNETRVFKFWSNKRADTSKVLEESADHLHFLLSIGLELGFNKDFRVINAIERSFKPPQYTHNEIISEIQTYISMLNKIRDLHVYIAAFRQYLNIISHFGIDGIDLEREYYRKNKINHKRQAEGY